MLNLLDHPISDTILHIGADSRNSRVHDLLEANRIIDRERTTRQTDEEVSRTYLKPRITSQQIRIILFRTVVHLLSGILQAIEETGSRRTSSYLRLIK